MGAGGVIIITSQEQKEKIIDDLGEKSKDYTIINAEDLPQKDDD
jgi:hypothetical protein